MGKLELKHLAPYLPYNLNLERINYKNERFKKLTAYDLCPDGEIDNIKPILRPLSDLNKNIQIGEHFMTFKEHLRRLFPAESIGTNIATWSSRSVEWLCEWHFDIFGLIDKGLAIDINTLKNV